MAKHLTCSGKPAKNRGIPPHRGGYHAAKSEKNANYKKIWFEQAYGVTLLNRSNVVRDVNPKLYWTKGKKSQSDKYKQQWLQESRLKRK